jgi:hypothetical protein
MNLCVPILRSSKLSILVKGVLRNGLSFNKQCHGHSYFARALARFGTDADNKRVWVEYVRKKDRIRLSNGALSPDSTIAFRNGAARSTLAKGNA